MKDDIIKFIRERGERLTENKLLFINLFESENMLTIDEICSSFKGKMNLSTIYRNLDKFIEMDYIEKIELDKEVYFTKKGTEKHHKHFVVCKKCHKKIEIDYCPIEDMNLKLKNFNVTSHKFELIGVCNDCKKTS